MSHHNHQHHSPQDEQTLSGIKTAFFLNLGFSIIELVGGFWTNSMAILTDALHDFGDSLAMALAWFFQKLSHKKRNIKFSFGYRRFSLLGAIINSVVLLTSSIIVIIAAVGRIIAPQQSDAKGMLILAILGLGINGLAILKLRKGKGLNARTVMLHLLEDVLGWAAVLVGSVVMIFVDVPILDPILSLGIAVFILYNVVRNLKNSFYIILQGVPQGIDIEQMKSCITATPNVLDVHDLHIWSLDDDYVVMSAHIVVDTEDHDIASQIKKDIRRELLEQHVNHVTLELEFHQEDCDKKCEDI
ncbi:cobalt transporter [Bacteroidia bacterium]|nr:cobalt transporter [Bacteroidia bacterium]